MGRHSKGKDKREKGWMEGNGWIGVLEGKGLYPGGSRNSRDNNRDSSLMGTPWN